MKRLSSQMNLVTLLGLPHWSTGPTGGFARWPEQVAAAGYESVQTFDARSAAAFHAAGLATSGIGRADTVGELEALVGRVEDWGGTAVSVHLGTGFEDDLAADRLFEGVAALAARTSVSICVETHRATLTQDPHRTRQLSARHPNVRFCADLSHWYTGCEMPYGDLDSKLAAIEPVLRRVHMVHGRISDPGCIQVAVRDGDDRDFVGHFRAMWRTVFDGFLDDPSGPEALPFLPELLPPEAHYARTVPDPDGPREETDRWQQAKVISDLAHEVFDEALRARAAAASTPGPPS